MTTKTIKVPVTYTRELNMTKQQIKELRNTLNNILLEDDLANGDTAQYKDTPKKIEAVSIELTPMQEALRELEMYDKMNALDDVTFIDTATDNEVDLAELQKQWSERVSK